MRRRRRAWVSGADATAVGRDVARGASDGEGCDGAWVGSGQPDLASFDRLDDVFRHGVGLGTRAEEQLEQHALFELLDRLDRRTAFVAPDRPRRGDPPRWQHVHPERDVADPSVPYGLADLFVHACSYRRGSAGCRGPSE